MNNLIYAESNYCEVCFKHIDKGKFCSDRCRKQLRNIIRRVVPDDSWIDAMFNYQRWYKNTAKGKAVQKAAAEKYKTTPKGRVAIKNKRIRWRAWSKTPKGKACIAANNARFLQTAKGKRMLKHKHHIRRTRKLEGTYDDSAKQFVLADKCAVCKSSKNLTIDHIIPLAKGGGHVYNNLTTLCKSCNSSKGVMSMKDFLIKYKKGVDKNAKS